MKKCFVISAILISLIVILSGCASLDKNTYKSQGKKNAVKYIEEKYGFKPSVKNVTAITGNSSPLPFSTASATGYVEVKMKHDGKIFYVYISGLNKNTDGLDNYQADLIESKLKEEITKLLPDAIQIDTCFGSSYSLSDDWDFGMVSVYFDGNNLSDVLDSATLNRAVVSVVNSDIDNIADDIVHETFGQNAEYYFVNYRSDDDLKKCEDLSYKIGTSEFGYDIEQNALYIAEYKRSYKTDFTEFKTTDFPLDNCGDLLYSYWNGTYCDVHVLTEDELNQLNIQTELQEKCISDYYSYNTDADYIVIYIPTSLFSDMDVDALQFYELEESVNGRYYGDSEPTFILDDGKYIGATFEKYNKDQAIIYLGK